MFKEMAGEVAGKVWKHLHGHANQDFDALKKATGEKTENLFLAIGWLLRENKIVGDNGIFNLK